MTDQPRAGVWTAAGPRAFPVLTLLIVAGTLVTMVHGYQDHAFYNDLARDPHGLRSAQWWRVVSPLLVDHDHWPYLVPNFLGTLVFGTAIERAAGRGWMLLAYLAGGIAGQLAGYAWDPPSAGNSVAMLGLAGCLLMAAFRPGRRAMGAPLFAVLCLGVAIFLTVKENQHGPAVLAGAAVGLLVLALGRWADPADRDRHPRRDRVR